MAGEETFCKKSNNNNFEEQEKYLLVRRRGAPAKNNPNNIQLCLGSQGRRARYPCPGQFARWFLGGTFRPRTDENDWCRHIFRESNKAADTHANC